MYALAVAGCASVEPEPPAAKPPPARKAAPPPARYNLTGYNAAFKQGYTDACAGKRNAERFKSDIDYQMGWSDGKSLCRK